MDQPCRVVASVDFLDLEVMTARATNHTAVQRTVMRALKTDRTPHVRCLTDPTNRSEHRFRLRIQDPLRAVELYRVHRDMAGTFGLAGPAVLRQVEVSLDLYGAGSDDLAAIYHGLQHPQSLNHRVYRDGRGSCDDVPVRLESLARRLDEGFTIAIGDMDRGAYQRFYFKRADAGADLPADQHRPRLELGLHVERPVADLAGWVDCLELPALAYAFRTRRPRAGLTKPERNAAEIVRGAGVLGFGERRPDLQRGRCRAFDPSSEACLEFNRGAYKALQHLGKRWQRVSRLEAASAARDAESADFATAKMR